MDFLFPILSQFAALVRVKTLASRRYTWFAIYLIANILRGVVLWALSGKTYDQRHWYSAVSIYTEPINAFLWLAMALELYGRISALYPGLGRKAWAGFALTVGILATWASVVEGHSGLLQIFMVFRRGVATVLVVAIGLLAILFGYFRNSLPKNSLVHASVMACYFITQALGAFGANLSGRILNWSQVSTWGAIISYLAWALLLTKNGETRPTMGREFSDTDLNKAEQLTADATQQARRIGRGNTGD